MSNSLRILLIEDNDDFAWQVCRIIRQINERHSVQHQIRVEGALQALASDSFDVVITDLMLPDAMHLESVQQLRAFNEDLPLIVLSSLESGDLAIEALQLGAQDYLIKDELTPHTLERSMSYAIERQHSKTETTRLVQRLQKKQRLLDERNIRLQELVETAHRFVDNVSHEFRTPLTVIREYTSLIRDGISGEVNSEQCNFLDVIMYRCDDLNTMVDDLLDSSKLEARILGMHRGVTAPVHVVDRAIAGLQLKARILNVELNFEPDEDLPPVFCDSEKAGRVVTNLVSNAIKFCDPESGRVDIQIHHNAETGDVEICVSDNGPGIEGDELQFLFDRFRQLGTSTQSSTKGFGLGLNIARELVDLNFGTISVASEPGQGTTFSFTLPVNDWPGIVQRYASRLARVSPEESILAFRVHADDSLDDRNLRFIDAFWRYTERQTDLIYPSGRAEWLILLPGSVNQIFLASDRFLTEHSNVSRNRPEPLPTLKFEPIGCFSSSSQANSDLLEAVTFTPVVC